MYLKLLVLACCFLTVVQSRPRIIGGHNAKSGQFPHQVSLQFGVPELTPFTHFCGGSILNEHWILTAVHCLELINQIGWVGNFVVKAGKHYINRIEGTEQTSIIDKYYKHENYTGTAQDPASYDIALVKLKTPLRLNKRVMKISLPEKDSEPSGQAILSGWGDINGNDPENPVMPNILQTVELPIISHEECRDAIAVTIPGSENILDDTNICTGPLSGGYSACSGDSGGPLIVQKQNGEVELIGIVSWGISPCGIQSGPSVYVKVSHFIDWISQKMANN